MVAKMMRMSEKGFIFKAGSSLGPFVKRVPVLLLLSPHPPLHTHQALWQGQIHQSDFLKTPVVMHRH